MFLVPDELATWLKMQLPWFLDEWDSLFWQRMAGFATGVCVTMYILQRVWKRNRLLKRVQTKREAVREACRLLVERLRTEGLTVSHRDKILALSFGELQRKLQTGDLKALEVLRAYQSKAMEVNERLNCVVEPIWEAEAQATALDLSQGKKGPLHGVPVSLKEAYYLEGYDCTAGMQHFIDKPLDHDAELVQILKKQGAVPFVRTNIPQGMMTFDSSNPIYGETRNPHDVTRGPGGSSSGEGALIAAGASCLGLGSDIGGSIRIPSSFCGVCGLKPTVERLGVSGMWDVGRGQTLVRVASGPMASNVDGLVMIMKAMLIPHLAWLDPLTQVVPFNTEVYEEKRHLCIGMFTDNGVMAAVPSVRRGVELAKAALQKRGHKIVEFRPPRVKDMFVDLFFGAAFGDMGTEQNFYLDNDILDPGCRLGYYIFKIPFIVKWILSFIVGIMDPDTARVLRIRMRGVPGWFKLAEQIEDYKHEFIREMRRMKVDAVLSPTMPLPAIPLGHASAISAAATYTTLYNLLNFPAGSLPVSKVTKADEDRLDDLSVYSPKNLHERVAKKMSQGTTGLPVCVQVAALPFQEELVLRIMREIEQEVNYHM